MSNRIAAALALVSVLVISGCAKDDSPVRASSGTSVNPPNTANETLISLETAPPQVTPTEPGPNEIRRVIKAISSGGRCARAACPRISTTIDSDGSFATGESSLDETAMTQPGVPGQLSAAVQTELASQIRVTTAAAVDALPKKPENCPSFSDGRDLEITYQLSDGEVTVSNCTTDFESHPLFKATTAALAEIDEQLAAATSLNT
jgi:hypothetical protein